MTTLKTMMIGGSAAALLSASVCAQTAQTPPASPSPPSSAAGSLYDPAQLPSFKGQVQLFTLTPRGDIDGMILTDGTEVKTPPHLSTEIAFTIRPGDTITIHGLKAASLPLVKATSITADATGKTVVDNGPGGPEGPEGRRPPPPPTPPLGASGPEAAAGMPDASNTVTGKIRMALHGPRGDVNGVLLDDGTMLRMPPPDATRFAAMLQPGEVIVVRGRTLSSPIGTLVEVMSMGPSADRLETIAPPPPPGGKRGPKGPPPA